MRDVRPKTRMTRLSLCSERRVGSLSCLKVQGSRAAGDELAKGSTGNLGLNAWYVMGVVAVASPSLLAARPDDGGDEEEMAMVVVERERTWRTVIKDEAIWPRHNIRLATAILFQTPTPSSG